MYFFFVFLSMQSFVAIIHQNKIISIHFDFKNPIISNWLQFFQPCALFSSILTIKYIKSQCETFMSRVTSFLLLFSTLSNDLTYTQFRFLHLCKLANFIVEFSGFYRLFLATLQTDQFSSDKTFVKMQSKTRLERRQMVVQG